MAAAAYLALMALMLLTWGCVSLGAGGGARGATQRVDFYRPNGERMGYGIVGSGRVDVYAPNGARLGSGVAR